MTNDLLLENKLYKPSANPHIKDYNNVDEYLQMPIYTWINFWNLTLAVYINTK